MRARWLLCAAVTLLAIGVAPAAGQPVAARVGIAPQASLANVSAQPGAPVKRLAAGDTAWWIPLASLGLPGVGQQRLGQERFILYLAAEAFLVVRHFASRASFEHERDRYLVLAKDVARAFVPGSSAVGNWDYYELMEKHLESGVYDRTPGTGTFTPERDTNTVNGAIWLKARQLSQWPDVDVEPDHGSAAYAAAVSYYARHAVGPEYRWSWRNAQLEWDLYRQGIRRANEASREARQYLAAIVVNHLLSMLDSFVTIRMNGGLGAPSSGFAIEGSLRLPTLGK
jgi:hypothetical protein